jgi:hypothetical protein
LSSSDGVFRIRKDGSGAPEVIVQDSIVGGVAVSVTGVYFTTRVLTGALRRCPLTGCQGPGDVVVSGQRWPAGVHADSEAAYFWLIAPGTSTSTMPSTLVTCQLPDGGGVRTLAQGLEFDQDFTFATSDWNSILQLNQSAVFWRESGSWSQHWLRRLAR